MREAMKNISRKMPPRPTIRKLGTIGCDVVETTPVVFRDRLYRLEYVRSSNTNRNNRTQNTWFHFTDVYTRTTSSPFAHDHHYGTAFADGEFMYVAASRKGSVEGDRIDIFCSSDLEQWERISSLAVEDRETFNTGLCKMNGLYTLLVETNRPQGFGLRFARSADMRSWEVLPADHIFQKDRYTGGPAIYTLPEDPYYYVFYVEACPGPFYVNCAARSRDLISWEYSPYNPVLMFDEEDRKIGSPFLTPAERLRISESWNINNSDMELCEFLGRTLITYSWGDQLGHEFLAEACFEGSKKSFLHSLFPQS